VSRRHSRLARAAVVAAALCLSCNYGEVVVVQPAAAGRGPLTLSIAVDPEDSAVARELGWSTGIPGADVTISPGAGDTATGPPIATLQTDANGAVSVPDLPDGMYLIEVRRLLSPAEMARLPATGDAVGFMAKEIVRRGNATVHTPASHRRSLVISEWAFNTEWIPAAGQDYRFGGFLELANNSDTTIYLDGLVIGDGFAWPFDYPDWPCAGFASFSNDPNGVWSLHFDSLPGTGRTYPLAPGATAVIATDAIDHSALAPTGLDLSHADFEFVGLGDPDNPSVPNTTTLLDPDRSGHGLLLNAILEAVVFVALPVDVASLPRQVFHTGDKYARVPRERILDVVSLLVPEDYGHQACPHLVHPDFDRYRARMILNNYQPGPVFSASRKVALTRPDGRKILQHTRNSNTDFFVSPRTPWTLP
jgi:hypothetical protein